LDAGSCFATSFEGPKTAAIEELLKTVTTESEAVGAPAGLAEAARD
jgi:hypothetical protein